MDGTDASETGACHVRPPSVDADSIGRNVPAAPTSSHASATRPCGPAASAGMSPFVPGRPVTSDWVHVLPSGDDAVSTPCRAGSWYVAATTMRPDDGSTANAG